MEKQILQKLDEISQNLNSFKEDVNEKFDVINERFDAIDEKFDTIDARFEIIDKKFDAIDAKFEIIDKKFDAIDARFEKNDSIFANFSETLSAIKKSTLIMEHEHTQKLDLLLELNSHNYEQHLSYEDRIVKLESITDLHSFELELLKKSN